MRSKYGTKNHIKWTVSQIRGGGLSGLYNFPNRKGFVRHYPLHLPQMKKIISVIIVLAMCVSLCACGTETTTQEKNTETMAIEQSEATISTEAEVQETTESIVYNGIL